MNPNDILKRDDIQVRLSTGDVWMYYEKLDRMWTVRESGKGRGHRQVIHYHGESELIACEIFVKSAGGETL